MISPPPNRQNNPLVKASKAVSFGKRLKIAREANDLRQEQLANDLSISQAVVSLTEKGERSFPKNKIKQLALRLGVVEEFFNLPLFVDFEKINVFHRSSQKRAQKDKSLIQAKFKFDALRVLDFFLALFDYRYLIPCEIPKLPLERETLTFFSPSLTVGPTVQSPQEAAGKVRRKLALKEDEPIVSFIRALEEAGVWLLALPIEADLDCDGFSFWFENIPVIAFAAKAPMDRVRFTLAHELGHLVMHDSPDDFQLYEKEANLFAGEFLMPSAAAKKYIKLPFTPLNLLDVKLDFGISFFAMLFRAKENEILSEDLFRKTLSIFKSKGWLENEPYTDQLRTERPRLLRQIFEEKIKNTNNLDRLKGLGMSQKIAQKILDCYAGTPVRSPKS